MCPRIYFGIHNIDHRHEGALVIDGEKVVGVIRHGKFVRFSEEERKKYRIPDSQKSKAVQ